MPIVFFSLRSAQVCSRYTLVISIFDFEIYLLKFSQKESGENFPAGRQKINKLIFHAADH